MRLRRGSPAMRWREREREPMTEDKPRILKAFTLMHGDDGKWAVTLNDYDDDGIYGDSISTAMIFLAIRKTLLGVLIVLAFVYAVMATVQIAKLPATDVVIVGLGWTGSILAHELAATGLNVVAIERGPWRDTATDFSPAYVPD